MKIVAFGASSSKNSINKKLASFAAKLYQAEVNASAQIELLDLNDFEMPIYSIDREKNDGIPALAQRFLDKISEADAIVISFAEHNGSYSAAYKNVFDWASRIESKVFQNKPMIILATSPGKGGAKSVLKLAVESTPHFNGDLRASVSIPSFFDIYNDADATISSESVRADLRLAVKSLSSAPTE